MGSGCCIPKSLKILPSEFAGHLPIGIVNITEESSAERINEFADLISESFCGTTSTPPEPVMAWTYDHGDGTFELDAGTAPVEVLKSEPSEERKAYFKFLADFIVHQCMRHGGCYALEDSPGGKLCSAAVTIPPNDKQLHTIGFCEMMGIIEKIGGETAVPDRFKGGISDKKMNELEKLMLNAHKVHAPKKHLYIQAFATKPDEQGKGRGSQLLDFIHRSAKFQQVPSYLETSGKKNEEFYTKRGWIVIERHRFSVSGIKFIADKDDYLEGGALLSMIKHVT